MHLRRSVGYFMFLVISLVFSYSLIAQPQAAKQPIPSEIDREKAQKLVKEVYKDEYAGAKTPEKKANLARKFIRRASEAKDDRPSHFVLLQEAQDLGLQAGYADVAVQAVDLLATTYQVDAVQLKIEIIKKVVKAARSPQQCEVVIATLKPIIDEAIATDQVNVAVELSRIAVATARESKNKEWLQKAIACHKDVQEVNELYSEAREAAPTFAPTDATSHLVVGKYFCFGKGDWDKGLPVLMKGSDFELKSLAANDLQGAKSPGDQVKLGDAWWDWAGNTEGIVWKQALNRAGMWYRRALPGLKGLEKDRIEKRFAQINAAVAIPDGHVTRLLRFISPNSLKEFLPLSPQDVKISFRNGTMSYGSKKLIPLVYNEHFNEISSVTIIGGLAPSSPHNLRVAVGPLHLILNWEVEDKNVYRTGPKYSPLTTTSPSALTPGKLHEIQIKQEGKKAIVLIDGKEHYSSATTLTGTVAVYTYQGVIAIREIIIEGKPDPTKTVTGASHNNIW